MSKPLRALTVGELKSLLALIPNGIQVCSCGPDNMGYEYSYKPYVDLKFVEAKDIFGNEAKDNILWLCLEHSERDDYETEHNIVGSVFKNDQGH